MGQDKVQDFLIKKNDWVTIIEISIKTGLTRKSVTQSIGVMRRYNEVDCKRILKSRNGRELMFRIKQ